MDDLFCAESRLGTLQDIDNSIRSSPDFVCAQFDSVNNIKYCSPTNARIQLLRNPMKRKARSVMVPRWV